jgi:RNA polymerase sigma-70 factor (ECF subfamily)
VQEEESLIRRAQQRDAEAFAQLYETYFDPIYRYIFFKTGRQAEAEDLTQQVFLKAFQSITSFQWRGVPFSSWLFRMAHNQVVDYLRKRSREKALPLDEARMGGDIDPASLAEHRLTLEQLRAASQRLSPAQQEVLHLRFAAGLSIAEVAAAMGKSEGAIKSLQHSALLRLRQLLSEGKED